MGFVIFHSYGKLPHLAKTKNTQSRTFSVYCNVDRIHYKATFEYTHYGIFYGSTIFWPYQVLRMYCTRVHKGHLHIKRSCSNVLKCHLNLAVDFALKMSRRFRDNLFTATFHPDWQRHTFTFLNISPSNHSHFPVDIVLKGQCTFLMDSHIEQLERDGFPLQGKYFQ